MARTASRPRTPPVLLYVLLAIVPVAILLGGAFDRRWMDDDGFINLRIVRNLLGGYGPVFNVGERVEVYTSPLWIGVVALGGLAVSSLEKVAVFGGIALMVIGLVFGEVAALRLHGASREHGDLASRIPLPLGAAVVAVVPAVWDYASSGLETGLSFFWLGTAYFGLVSALVHGARRRGAHVRTPIALAAWLGLGPLIRPELALYSASLFLVLATCPPPALRGRSSAMRRRLVTLLVAAAFVPVAYQVFRMGYFGAMTANTAIAKEAFRVSLKQGYCYARDFFGLYGLVVPLSALAVLWSQLTASTAEEKRGPLFLAMVAPVISAVLHGVYVVVIGGDYMHGRMFLPVLFAALLPVMIVPVRPPPDAQGLLRYLPIVIVPLVVWLPICGATLRVHKENVCGIGDERGWYARMAKVDNPIELASYKQHQFYEIGREVSSQLERACRQKPGGDAPGQSNGCRVLYVDDADFGTLVPNRTTYRVTEQVDERIGAIGVATAVGLAGYLLPPTVHLVDRLGLGDPIGSRLALRGRGRPGHEKSLANAWIVARFALPESPEDAGVKAARHALSCGPLAALQESVRGPLTAGRFFANLLRAPASQRIRIPRDPFEAEQLFCGTRPLPTKVAGPSGGSTFRWHCPDDTALAGITGAWKDATKTELAEVHPWCRTLDPAVITGDLEGPLFGEKGTTSFRTVCPSKQFVIGMTGTTDRVVQRVQLRCASLGGGNEGKWPPSFDLPAAPTAKPFDLRCEPGQRVIGLAGRAGALVDAIGIVCEPAR